jgi:hypothetical protein
LSVIDIEVTLAHAEIVYCVKDVGLASAILPNDTVDSGGKL